MRLKHLAAVPIVNGLGEAATLEDESWPRYIRTTDFAGPRELRDSTIATLPPEVAVKAVVQRGDILMSAAGTVGKTYIHLSDEPACFAGYLVRFRPAAGVDPRFVAYWTETPLFLDQIAAGKVTSTIDNFSAGKYQNVAIQLPPSLKQEGIADFLDNETARIDALITKKRRIIELLVEHRNTTVSRAVTTGIGSGRRAATGSAFAPEIAHGWRLMSLRHVVSEILDTSHKTAPVIEGGEYLVVRTANVKSSRLVLEGAHFTDRPSWLEWTKRGVPSPGDVLFTREAPAGEACLVPEGLPLCIGQRTVVLRPQRALMRGAWLLHSLYSGPAQRFIEVLSRSTTVAHINMADIPNIPIAVPPLTEQDELLQSIEAVSKRCGELTARLTRQIGLLQERRQALITAAVSGELEVPEVAA